MTALRGMLFQTSLNLDTNSGIWSCFFLRVSFDRNLAAITGSRPYKKASLQALPIAPAPARIAALAVYEKEVLEVDLECAFVCLATPPACALCATLRSVTISPSFNRLHLLESAAAAKLP